jgi:hypothetical protein
MVVNECSGVCACVNEGKCFPPSGTPLHYTVVEGIVGEMNKEVANEYR